MGEQDELADLSNPFLNETAARIGLETWRWPNGPVCPFCGRNETIKPLGGRSMGEGWYHCRWCRKKFTVRVGTMLERSKIPLHMWLIVMLTLPKGTTAYHVHKRFGMTYKSARLMVERINRYHTPNAGPVWWERKQH